MVYRDKGTSDTQLAVVSGEPVIGHVGKMVLRNGLEKQGERDPGRLRDLALIAFTA